MKTPTLTAAIAACLIAGFTCASATSRPNVILVMTDDQGWGEVGFHGNKVLKTPNLDRFAAEGTELTQFYVSPMCTPTRSSLMTGRYHFRTGAHDTYIGRSNMNPQETTIAEVFAGAGYRTGIFGKWHLGENYPMRAVDQGFQKVVVHGGGGIGQFADYPKNSYWDPILLYNDTFKQAKGYCTDVFIDESISFIKEAGKRPFFCYIPLNAPHAPFNVAKEFSDPYESQVKEKGRQWTPSIYGMITQLDGAFQRLLDAVEKMGLRKNTIIIFMTDNGPNSTFYTAGLRARKSSVYENGFRVPFAIQWPAGIPGRRKLNDPTMHLDLLPTLAAACGIQLPTDLKVDGKSILPLLVGDVKELPERFLFMQHNRADVPPKYRNCMVRRGPWKVVGNRGTPEGFELYNIEADPGESKNLAAAHPDKVQTFVREYGTWFDDVTAELQNTGGVPHPIELNPIQKQDFRFTWQDWWGEKAGWRPNNYGRWRMNNPGLIKRFDVTILPHRQHHKQPSAIKFIWQGQEIAKRVSSTPEQIVLEKIELAEGTGFMEVQLHINGKMWGAQEVRIKPHSAVSTLPTEARVTTPAKAPQPGNYRIGNSVTITFNVAADTLKNPKGTKEWKSGNPKLNDGSNLSGFDFPALGIKSWNADSFGESAKTIWDGAKLNGLTLTFSGHNFGKDDSMKQVDFSGSTINTTGNQPFLFTDLTGANFSGATLNIAGFGGRMTAYRDAKLTGADFSAVIWGVSTDGLNKKTELFFSGGPGSTSAADKDQAVTFEGADLSNITGVAKAAMIKNLGKFDGTTAIGAKYNSITLSQSGWSAEELNAAGWQKVPTR